MSENPTIKILLKSLFLIFLVSFWPVIHFVSINFSENLISHEIFLFGLIIFLLFSSIYFFCYLVLKLKKQIFLNFLILFIFTFFLFGGFEQLVIQLNNTVEHSAKYAVFLQLCTFVTLVKFIKDKNTLSIFLVVLWIFPISKFLLNEKIKNFDIVEKSQVFDKSEFKNRHNIYYLVLDEYAREDVLKKYIQIDNTSFLRKMQEKGFFYKSDSYSNFDDTPLSISTTLNMDYYTFNKGYDINIIQNQSPIVQTLNYQNYENIFVESGGNSQIVCNGEEDLCIKGGTINDDIALLIKMTPFWRIMRSRYFYRYFESLYLLTDLEESIDKILKIYLKKNKNYFIFAHILSPHDPRRYNNDCSKYFSLNPGLGKQSIDSYKIDLPCLNKSILRTVEQILTKDDSDPIIFITSDHGISRSMLNYPSDELIRLKNLILIKSPKKCEKFIEKDITPVNFMNFSISCLTERKKKFVNNKHFIHNDQKNGLIEVTDQVIQERLK